jgi:hypothetical protein
MVCGKSSLFEHSREASHSELFEWLLFDDSQVYVRRLVMPLDFFDSRWHSGLIVFDDRNVDNRYTV